MKVLYLVYQLTNMVNGKIYVGCHMTKNLDDGYMGSGKRLSYAKQKYGLDNFKKEILSVHETPEEMFAEEARIVNEEFVGRSDVYNVACGGRGSWIHINLKLTPEQRSHAGKMGGFANKDKWSPATWAKFKAIVKSSGHVTMTKLWATRKDHMAKSREKAVIAATSKEANALRKNTFQVTKHQQGERNSQFGSCWITNGQTVRKIKAIELQQYLASGWARGRKQG